MRIVVLDTETTGLKPEDGHRIIEVGAIELIGRRPSGRRLHYYLNPEREVDPGAVEVHGLTYERLMNEPRFEEILNELLEFLKDSELVIHNAPFDLGFLNHELALLNQSIRIQAGDGGPDTLCQVTDSLKLARELHPGQRNSLDALCQRYGVSNKHRHFHGALLDAELLAEVYLLMTRGQNDLGISEQQSQHDLQPLSEILARGSLKRAEVSQDEAQAHQHYLAGLEKECAMSPIWGKIL
ncbi:MAG: DNA polymerase III subunit epsilon [Burkholderiaceae bacterium]|jgi:DNA polymerase-3 subunit epsilon